MPESTLTEYTFLPWLRQGIASEIPNRDGGTPPDGERAAVKVRFDVNGEAVVKDVELIGPGDIIGLNPRAIVKTEPRNWITDFEPNYLPYIEFYDEDFPWRYTPASAAGNFDQSRLRPWLFLAVLSEDEFEDQKTAGTLPVIKIKKSAADIFPKPEQIWAWAHVHVSKNILEGNTTPTGTAAATAAVDRLEDLLAENPDNASSRLMCPRKLKKNTAYHAFLIPSFELGRLAGLGQSTNTPNLYQASWGAENQIEFPIYYRWYFRTGERGDFEYLVDLLEPRPVDKRVGIRDMDMQKPGFEMDGLKGPLSVIGLEGALKSPQTVSSPEFWPPESSDFNNPPAGSAESFLLQLEEKVNLQFDLQQKESEEKPHPDPIISPPLYGKWHAKAEKLAVQEPGWVNELNKDPRNRAAAGSGTKVIQQNQEKYMQQAWSQLGDVLQVNQKIRQLQLSLTASAQIQQKHIKPMTETQLMAFTMPLHHKILGSPTTIGKQLEDSRIPAASVDSAIRKIVRPRGPIMKKALRENSPKPLTMIALLNNEKFSAAPALPDAKANLNLDESADKLSPQNLPEWLLNLGTKKIHRWILLAVVLVLVLLTPLIGFIGAIVPITGIGTALVVLDRFRKRKALAFTLKEANWKPELLAQIPSRHNFSLSTFGAPMTAVSGTPGKDSIEAERFRIAVKDLQTSPQNDPPKPTPKAVFDFDNATKKIRAAINPVVSIKKRADSLVNIHPSIQETYLKPIQTLVPVMAHPVFPDPMYRPLRDISAEFLVPNLHLIPNNTVSLMEVNERFIESYIVGLNHEMGRELLWREYPTDQRGSYFRQFWDVGDRINRDLESDKAIEEAFLDVKPLHTWGKTTELGKHGNIPNANPGEERLVLVIRGDLLKKYPTAVIFAQKAMWATDENGNDIRKLDDSDPDNNLQSPLFKAEIEPDLKFLGFDLTVSIVQGSANRADNNPGWFFVIQERPGEPRFGLDDKSEETPEFAGKWDDLAWEHLEDFEHLNFIDLDKTIKTNEEAPMPEHDEELTWGLNAADMAYILYQVPVMVAFHAADMLKKGNQTP